MSKPPAASPVRTRKVKQAPEELPSGPAGALRAILAGNYGVTARGIAEDNPRQEKEAANRYVGRLRHVMFRDGAEKAGDALGMQPLASS